MNKRRFWTTLAIVTLLAPFVGGCGDRADNEVRIGIIAPLTTDLAYVGESTLEAAELAVGEVNTEGGLEIAGERYEVILIVEDSEDSAEVATAAARKLINQEEIVALIGPQASRNAIPVARVAEDSQIPMISPWSTNPETTAQKSYVFRIAFVDDFQGQVMARFAMEDLQVTRAAVLYDVASVYNRGIAEIFREVFESAGGDVVAFETYTTGEEDFREALARVKESDAQVLYLPNYPQEVRLQAQQAAALGLEIPIIGSDSWGGMTLEEGAAVEGSYFSTHWYSGSDDAQAQNFVAAYEEAYGREPDDIAALTYDAMKMLFQTIESQDSIDPTAIRNGLNSLERYVGVTGQMEYRGTGDPVKSAVVLQIVDGVPQFYRLVNP